MKSPMERTQVYLPASLKKRINRHAQLSHSNVSDIIRRGAEMVLTEETASLEEKKKRFKKALQGIAGMWADRDPKEFEAIRERNNFRFPEWQKRP